jgi:hypothetical protein
MGMESGRYREWWSYSRRSINDPVFTRHALLCRFSRNGRGARLSPASVVSTRLNVAGSPLSCARYCRWIAMTSHVS